VLSSNNRRSVPARSHHFQHTIRKSSLPSSFLRNDKMLPRRSLPSFGRCSPQAGTFCNRLRQRSCHTKQQKKFDTRWQTRPAYWMAAGLGLGIGIAYLTNRTLRQQQPRANLLLNPLQNRPKYAGKEDLEKVYCWKSPFGATINA
jgi:hypothetical protein